MPFDSASEFLEEVDTRERVQSLLPILELALLDWEKSEFVAELRQDKALIEAGVNAAEAPTRSLELVEEWLTGSVIEDELFEGLARELDEVCTHASETVATNGLTPSVATALPAYLLAIAALGQERPLDLFMEDQTSTAEVFALLAGWHEQLAAENDDRADELVELVEQITAEGGN